MPTPSIVQLAVLLRTDLALFGFNGWWIVDETVREQE